MAKKSRKCKALEPFFERLTIIEYHWVSKYMSGLAAHTWIPLYSRLGASVWFSHLKTFKTGFAAKYSRV